MLSRIVQVGDEAAVIIPDEIVKKLDLHAGEKVNVEYDKVGRKIIIHKIEKK